ncbi:Dihydrolipoyllysine-residue acetyltransferase component of pyruvate dehydrogenase, putative [Pediculus humanus corporis]|uniref:Acetyltransferase component of pyruvate dehydrogenase complex n=1 Tax=Pediculus humanus subsp. corporis TaxID=121224 RepID=E0VAQ6_PEDHC|nr:Dihydrolipoyllysine-residue acetyltransferase component of pyruvate dehydrogenase, putative [Pediculus humanus corporis]EEB10462.1 Dihydrolipoyllysine-residue acetyltransferase component of pyruvate dehydrogenase, putative [Pediculus humanus corporis]
MESGTIISWEKKEGDKLNEGDLLAEIETDKASMGFETPEEGYLAKILVSAGTKNVPIGKLVCIIVSDQADVDAFKNFVSTESDKTEEPDSKKSDVKESPTVTSSTSYPPPPPPPSSPLPPSFLESSANTQNRVYSSPLAKKIASELGLSLEKLGSGSGIHGSIKAPDLQNFKSLKISQQSVTQPAFEELTSSNAQSVLTQHFSKSKQTIPHYYLSTEINIDNTVDMNTKINKLKEKDGISLSLNDFIIKATALACKQVPEANSSWQDTFIRQFNNVDVNVAVITENGLLFPIVFSAETKGLNSISTEVKELVAKAREGKLDPNDYQGGTVSIINLGMYGISNFSAIINPPQACILSVGSKYKKVVPHSKSDKGYKISDYLSVTLSCDHRVLDGAVGAQWVSVFKKYLENPDLMLL